MATTYTTQWTGRDAKTWSLVLHLTNDVTDRLTDLSIEEDDQDDYFAPIRSWTGRATLLGMEAGVLRQLLSPSAQASPCEVVRDGVTRWAGFVKPESLSQSFPGEGETVSVTLQGRLNTAGGQYMDADGGRGFVTLGALLQEALYLCGYASTDVLWWPTRYQLDGTGEGLSVLSLQVSRGRFYEDSTQDGQETDSTTADVGGVSKTPYEVMVTAETVIEEIMKFFGLTLHERGTGLMAVSRGCNSYSSITLGGLTSITPQYVGNTPTTTASYTVAPGDIRRSGYTVSYRQGVKRVTVRSELSLLRDDILPAVSCSGRKYVGSYTRNCTTPGSSGSSWPVSDMRLKVYELSDNSGDAVFTAFLSYPPDTDYPPVGRAYDLSSWKNPDGGLDDSEPYHNIPSRGQIRMGCFPCQAAFYFPYRDAVKNYDFTEGFMFNPGQREGFAFNDWPTAPVQAALQLRNRNACVWKGGAFILSFQLCALNYIDDWMFRGQGSDGNAYCPTTDDLCTIGVFITIGDYHWDGEHFATAHVNPVVYTPLSIQAEEDSPAWPNAGGIADEKTLAMPYNGESGLFMELKDENGNELQINGSVSISFYVIPKWNNDSNNQYQCIFFSNFSLKYRLPDDETDAQDAAAVASGESDTRTIYRRTRNGFDAEGHSVDLMLSSYTEGAAGCLSTLLNGQDVLTTLQDTVTGEVNTPERLLLGNLARDYDRIVEKRVVTVPLAGTMDEAGYDPRATYLLPDSDKSWHLLAVTENQAAGTAQLTLMDWAE